MAVRRILSPKYLWLTGLFYAVFRSIPSLGPFRFDGRNVGWVSKVIRKGDCTIGIIS